MKTTKPKLLVLIVLTFLSSLALAEDNFMILKAMERKSRKLLLNAEKEKSFIELDSNLSKDFSQTIDDLSSKDNEKIANRVDELIGTPLISTAQVGFGISTNLLQLGYFYSYTAYALAQNPVFPSVDAYLARAHNLWFYKNWEMTKDFSLKFFPIIGYKTDQQKTREISEIVDEGFDLNLDKESPHIFYELNLRSTYAFNFFDFHLDFFSYEINNENKLIGFTDVQSFLSLGSHKLGFITKFQFLSPTQVSDSKRVELVSAWSYRSAIKLQLAYTEFNFINPALEMNFFDLKINLAYTQRTLDSERNLKSENYEVTLAYNF